MKSKSTTGGAVYGWSTDGGERNAVGGERSLNRASKMKPGK